RLDQALNSSYAHLSRFFHTLLSPSPDSTILFSCHSAATRTYTLSLHDALPIYDVARRDADHRIPGAAAQQVRAGLADAAPGIRRSEEQTSELQSRVELVWRLLLEKKKQRWEELITASPPSS